MRRKGFTLVELLAVIAIIGVLSIITVPMVMTTIEDANKSAFTVGVQSVIDATKIYISGKDEIFEDEEIPIEELKEELENYNYISGVVLIDDAENISVDGISDGNYCASGTKNNLRVVKGDCSMLDTSPPVVNVLLNKKTSNSLTILVNASDSTSGIYGYSYSTDGVNYSEINNQNIYTINNLDKGQTQKIYVRVYNNIYDGTNSEQNISFSMTEKEVEFTTLNIDKPRFVVSSSESSASSFKIVDIIYPKDEGGYIYTYEFNGVEHTVTEDTIRLTINENGVLIARVQAADEIFENELRIAGLDNEGPVANIIYNQNWETSKKITVEVTYEQTGLPDEPYSYDGGKTWVSSNEKVYVAGEDITDKIQVRDVLGNITTKFLVNGSETDQIIINNIDTEKPICTLQVTKGTLGSNGWYTSNVEVGFADMYDVSKYCSNGVCENKTPGSGIKSSSIDISQVTSDGTTIVTGTVVDNVGLTNTCSIEVKKDSTITSVEAKSSTVNLKFKENYALTNLFTIGSFGSSSGTTTCYLIVNNTRSKTVNNNSELSLGINVIECEATTGAGISRKARVTIKHSYTGTATCSAGTLQNGTCYFESNASVCGTEEKEVTVQEYSTCATTVNTCQYGCDSVWNANINCTTQEDKSVCNQWKCNVFKSCTLYDVACNCTTYSTASCATYSNVTSANLSSTMSTASNACANPCRGLFDCKQSSKTGQYEACGSETIYDNTRCPGKLTADCVTYGTKQVCAGGYEQKNCSSCKTGSPNACQAGYVDRVTTQTVASSCNKSEYIKYTCTTTGTNTSTNSTISATVQGSTCQF